MSQEKTPRQPRKPFQNAGKKETKTYRENKRGGRAEGRMEKPFRPRPAEERGKKSLVKKDKPYAAREDGDKPPKKVFRKERPSTVGGPFEKRPKKSYRDEKSSEKFERAERPAKKIIRRKTEGEPGSPQRKFATRSGVRIKATKAEPAGIRLNKYIANAGICSRREADDLIRAGVIKVNGEVVTTLGAKVMPGDKVQYADQTLSNERKQYLLLNKQKGYVTTTKDPHAKNTVMELIAGACKERIYPVGRLDRNTTGLLLFTNDGELAKKLMHPASRILKMYHVVLDQPLSKQDLMKVAGGIEIDGDRIQVDGIEYVEDAKDRREVGMEIHSGQNRIVRRIFESLGYKVTKLDRVMYAGLTKKNLPRGKWRCLSEQEVINLKKMR